MPSSPVHLVSPSSATTRRRRHPVSSSISRRSASSGVSPGSTCPPGRSQQPGKSVRFGPRRWTNARPALSTITAPTQSEPFGCSGFFGNGDRLPRERLLAAFGNLFFWPVQPAEHALSGLGAHLDRILRRAHDHRFGTARVEAAGLRRGGEGGRGPRGVVEVGRVAREY